MEWINDNLCLMCIVGKSGEMYKSNEIILGRLTICFYSALLRVGLEETGRHSENVNILRKWTYV